MQRTVALVGLLVSGACTQEQGQNLQPAEPGAHLRAIMDLDILPGELAVSGRTDRDSVVSSSGTLAAFGDSLFVLDETRSEVLRVSLADGRVAYRLPVDEATRIALRPDGERLYVTEEDSILVVEARLRQLDRVSLPTGVAGLGFAPDAATAYASLGEGLGIAVIDTGAERTGDMEAVRVVVADRIAGALVELDPDGRVLQRTEPVGDVIGRVAVAADGRAVAAYRRAADGAIEDGIVVADMAGGVLSHAALGAALADLALDGAGGRALAALENGTLALVDVDRTSGTFCQVVAAAELGASGAVALAPAGGAAYAYAWDPQRGEIVALDATLAPVRVLAVR